MPTYAYRCPKCGHEYDKLQKISDDSLASCPECGTKGDRLITGGAGFVFKGSGFYITDYKRAGEKKASDEGAKKEDTGAKKEGAKGTESKPKTTKPKRSSES